MGLLLWIIFGAIVGFIADAIDTSVSLSWVERIGVGVVGSIIGGTLGSLVSTGRFDITSSAGFDIVSIVLSVIGALITLFIWKRAVHRSATY